MKANFLKLAGVKSEGEFYNKYPTEEAFFKKFPQAKEMAYGGSMMRKKPTEYSGGGMLMPQGRITQMGSGGYKVTRSSDRKGKTHKVTGPDGSVKFFGDPNLKNRPNNPEAKKSWYARHKQSLDKNPHFRAYARSTWGYGGKMDEYAYGGDMDYGYGGNMKEYAKGGYDNPGFKSLPANVQNKIMKNSMKNGGMMDYQTGGKMPETSFRYRTGDDPINVPVNRKETYINTGKDSSDLYKFVGDTTGNIRYAKKEDGKYRMMFADKSGKEPYNPKKTQRTFQSGGQLTEFQGGGTHQENPNGGIPQGPDASVEEGETKMDAANYIFSDRLTVPKDLSKELQMPFLKGKTFAAASKAIKKKYDPQGKKETDLIVQNAIERELKKLIAMQEVHKADLIVGHQKEIADLQGNASPTDQMMPPQEMQMQGAPQGMPQQMQQMPQEGMQMGYGGMRKQMQTGGSYIPEVEQALRTAKNNQELMSTLSLYGFNTAEQALDANAPQEYKAAYLSNRDFNYNGTSTNTASTNTASTDSTTNGLSRIPEIDIPMSATTANSVGTDDNTFMGKVGDIPITSSITAAQGIGTVASGMSYKRALKGMEPVAKDPRMFNLDQEELEYDPIDSAPYLAMLDAEAAQAQSQIMDVAGKSPGTTLANIGSLTERIGRAKATTEQDLRMKNEQLKQQTYLANLRRGMFDKQMEAQVTDWNDQDLNAFQSALLNFKSTQAQNVSTSLTNLRREQAAKDLESGQVGTLGNIGK